MDVKDMTKEQLIEAAQRLERILKDEKEEREHLAKLKRKEILQNIYNNRQFVLENIIPKHGRTTCSDGNPVNGWADGGGYRCVRCAMLELIEMIDDEGGEVDDWIDYEVSFDMWMERVEK